MMGKFEVILEDGRKIIMCEYSVCSVERDQSNPEVSIVRMCNGDEWRVVAPKYDSWLLDTY